MQRHFDDELRDLKQDILKMGVFAQDAIRNSIESLKNRDRELAKSIIENDTKIDKLELVIDEKCVDLIARHQPLAKDLRFITVGMKLNSELERIADIAVDIAQRVLEILDHEPEIRSPENAVTLPTLSGRVEFRAVSFRYQDEKSYALTGIDLAAEPNRIVALIGQTGSGGGLPLPKKVLISLSIRLMCL